MFETSAHNLSCLLRKQVTQSRYTWSKLTKHKNFTLAVQWQWHRIWSNEQRGNQQHHQQHLLKNRWKTVPLWQDTTAPKLPINPGSVASSPMPLGRSTSVLRTCLAEVGKSSEPTVFQGETSRKLHMESISLRVKDYLRSNEIIHVKGLEFQPATAVHTESDCVLPLLFNLIKATSHCLRLMLYPAWLWLELASQKRSELNDRIFSWAKRHNLSASEILDMMNGAFLESGYPNSINSWMVKKKKQSITIPLK